MIPDSSRNTRAVSRSSSSDNSLHELPRSTVVNGSMNSVAPVFEAPCTTPGTRCRLSALTCTTSRSERIEMTLSCRASCPDADPMTPSSAEATSSYARLTCLRRIPRFGVALSGTSPRSSIDDRMRRSTSASSGIPSAIPDSVGATLLTDPNDVLARRSTSSNLPTASNSLPESIPSSAARATACEASSAANRSTSPSSSSTRNPSDVSVWSSSTSASLWEGRMASARFRAGGNTVRLATDPRTVG